MQSIDISVAVCSFNRAPYLRRTLESLARLETGNRFTYEILVVDNASTDDTPRVIQSAEKGFAVDVRSVHETHKGIAVARNRAIHEARGQWIAFQDDDQWVETDWLAKLWDLAERRNCLCVGGAVHLDLTEGSPQELSPVCRGLLGDTLDQTKEFRYTRKVGPGTNNLLLAQSLLDEIGDFDEQISDSGGEDADLYRRIRAAGHECWFTPDAIVHHVIPPERLRDDYMRWTALRHGGHVALREYRNWGRWNMPWVTAARLGQALIVYFPKYVAARLGSDRQRTLGYRCLLWRSEGYLRSALRFMMPSLFSQRAFRSSISFRSGREQLMEKQSG